MSSSEQAAQPSSPHAVQAQLGPGDRWFLLLSSVVVTALVATHCWRLSSAGRETIEIRRMQPLETHLQLDLNNGTWVEFMLLDGIGEPLARRIVEDRERRGPFRSVDELTRVNGIGPSTLQKVRPFLTISSATSEPAPGP